MRTFRLKFSWRLQQVFKAEISPTLFAFSWQPPPSSSYPLRSIIQIQAVCHHTGKTFSCIPSLSFSFFKYSFSVAWSSSSSFLSPPPPLLSSQPHLSDASSSRCPPPPTDTGSSPGAVMAPMRPSLPPHWTWSPFRIDFMSHIVARQKERCGNIFYSHQLCKIVTGVL